jgi:hypothetical protein
VEYGSISGISYSVVPKYQNGIAGYVGGDWIDYQKYTFLCYSVLTVNIFRRVPPVMMHYGFLTLLKPFVFGKPFSKPFVFGEPFSKTIKTPS